MVVVEQVEVVVENLGVKRVAGVRDVAAYEKIVDERERARPIVLEWVYDHVDV